MKWDYQRRNVTYGCSADDFQSALTSFDVYRNYVVSVTRNIYDSSNNILPNTTGAARIDYIAEILLLRRASHQA